MLGDVFSLTALEPRSKFVLGLWFRVGCAGVFLVFVALIDVGGVFDCRPITYLSLSALIILNALYWTVGVYCRFDLRQFYFHWIIDLILIVGVLIGLGSWSESVAISSLTLIIVTSATFISRYASLLVAGSASTALLGWCLQMSGTSQFADEWTMSKVVFVAGGGSIFFFMIAFLAGTLAEALKSTNELLERRNDELAKRNTELHNLQDEIEFQTKVVAHDIRGPVSAAASAIIMAKRMFESGYGGEEIEEGGHILRVAIESLNRADQMICRLRELQEVEGASFRESEIVIEELLRELSVEWNEALVGKMVSLKVNCAGVVICGDRALIEVLFRNLVSNAVRYVPGDGTGMIEIAAGRSDDRVFIVVADNGPGIPEAAYNEVFKMFRRLHTGDGPSGLGVGLGLVRRVVERHGGRVWADASALGGAAIYVELPESRMHIVMPA